MFKYKLLNIKKDIERVKDKDLSFYIESRLNKTLDLYIEDIERAYDNLILKGDYNELTDIRGD